MRTAATVVTTAYVPGPIARANVRLAEAPARMQQCVWDVVSLAAVSAMERARAGLRGSTRGHALEPREEAQEPTAGAAAGTPPDVARPARSSMGGVSRLVGSGSLRCSGGGVPSYLAGRGSLGTVPWFVPLTPWWVHCNTHSFISTARLSYQGRCYRRRLLPAFEPGQTCSELRHAFFQRRRRRGAPEGRPTSALLRFRHDGLSRGGCPGRLAAMTSKLWTH
jgi:hypothetical protein